jgi:CRISPR-associated protein Csb1
MFRVDEETAREIGARFILDLEMLRSYGRDGGKEGETLNLTHNQKKLLLAIALWKVRELLGRTFSYRSGCKPQMRKASVMTDTSDKPHMTELPVVPIKRLIEAAGFRPSR